jgi:hypothetical protein
MTERPASTRLHDWLDETVGQTPDPVEGTRQVMSQVEETSQAGRWLPFPVLRRRATKTRTTADTKEVQPSPIPASNGHTPTAIGRTTSMLSPVKAITAGAIVFALGGVMLIAQPFQQPGSVPGAESDAAAAPAWVTATVQFGACDFGETAIEDGVTQERGMNCWGQTWTSDDPRLDGEGRVAHNADSFDVDGQGYSLVTSIVEVSNDAGGWQCTNADRLVTPASTLFSTSRFSGDRLSCVGYGGNEGYSAILTADWSGSPKTLEGLIFSGEMPPMPEFPSSE